MSDQLELIERPPQLTRAAARQQAMQAARMRAERGMAQSESSADWSIPGWCALAAEKLRMFARSQGVAFWTIEMAREALREVLPMPPDLRAFGKATVMAIKAGYIERVPKVFLPAASSNGCAKAAYRRGPKC